eukprot:736429-Hanusia_phi.AAC.2
MQEDKIERRAWFLRALCCCFCGQWQMLSAQQRERQQVKGMIASPSESCSQKMQREEEAVRKIAELYGQMFANTRFELTRHNVHHSCDDGTKQVESCVGGRSEGGS